LVRRDKTNGFFVSSPVDVVDWPSAELPIDKAVLEAADLPIDKETGLPEKVEKDMLDVKRQMAKIEEFFS